MKTEGVSAYYLPGVTVDVSSHRVLRDDQDVGLPDLSYRLIRVLCEHAPDVVAKDELIAGVWEHDVVSDETLAQRVRLLRKALGESSEAAQAIVSVRGRGYRIAAPVTVGADQGLLQPVADVGVYNDYLLGRHLTFSLTGDNLEEAARILTRVTGKAPDFAEAFTTLGYAYSFLGTPYGRRAPLTVFHQAKSAVLRAISIRPDSAEAHSLYADILAWFDWDFATAESEHRSAIALDDRLVLGYALLLSALERHDEALALMDSALERTPDDVYLRSNAAWRYFDAGRYKEALDLAVLSSEHADALTIMGNARLALGEIPAAVAHFESDLGKYPGDPIRIANLARASFVAGETARARELEASLHRTMEAQFASPALAAMVRFAAGDDEAGFTWLDKAVEDRVRDVIFLKVATWLTDYRDDARYRRLLDIVGLPA